MRRVVAAIAWVALVGTAVSVRADLPCWITSEVCTEGPETRTIDGVEVFRDCWRWDYVYTCGGATPLADDCAQYREQGCVQVNSTCAQTASDGTCDIYQQTLSCGDVAQSTVAVCGPETFCMSGNCADKSYNANTGFVNAYGTLAGALDAASTMDPLTFEIFRGYDRRCRIAFGSSIYDCCDADGILNDVIDCQPEEEELARARRPVDRTVYIGEYCSESINVGLTRVCVERKRTYCVFGSVLARIIQTDGRPQIGKGWGDAENPDCSGYTVEQLASLDFSQMNFADFIATVSIPPADTTQTQTEIQNYYAQ